MSAGRGAGHRAPSLSPSPARLLPTRPPILTDVAVDAHPARDAITVIATNQVFARKSIKARLPFALIGVCERDKGRAGPRPRLPRQPRSPQPSSASSMRSVVHARPPHLWGPLPSWQVAPTHCSGQMHSKPSTWSTQVPPAAQGLEAHSSMSAEGQREGCGRCRGVAQGGAVGP